MNAAEMNPVEDKTLLIVEDDRPLRERLARAMEARGFTVSPLGCLVQFTHRLRRSREVRMNAPPKGSCESVSNVLEAWVEKHND